MSYDTTGSELCISGTEGPMLGNSGAVLLGENAESTYISGRLTRSPQGRGQAKYNSLLEQKLECRGRSGGM